MHAPGMGVTPASHEPVEPDGPRHDMGSVSDVAEGERGGAQEGDTAAVLAWIEVKGAESLMTSSRREWEGKLICPDHGIRVRLDQGDRTVRVDISDTTMQVSKVPKMKMP